MAVGNRQRIEDELTRAASDQLGELGETYQAMVVRVAMDLVAETEEHFRSRTNINQRFRDRLSELGATREEGVE